MYFTVARSRRDSFALSSQNNISKKFPYRYLVQNQVQKRVECLYLFNLNNALFIKVVFCFFNLWKVIYKRAKIRKNIFPLLLCKFDRGTTIDFLRLKIIFSATFEQNSRIFRYLATVIVFQVSSRWRQLAQSLGLAAYIPGIGSTVWNPYIHNFFGKIEFSINIRW